MHEDKQEQLEAMFPDGFIISYIMPNKDLGFYYCNPKNDGLLVYYMTVLDSALNSGEDDGKNVRGFEGGEDA